MSKDSHHLDPTIELSNDELLLAQLILSMSDSERNDLRVLIDKLLKDESG